MKGLYLLTCTVLFALQLAFIDVASAQSQNRVNIKGVVTEQSASGAHETVPFAMVKIPSIGIQAVANEKGEYQIMGIIPSTYSFEISCLGYETQTISVTVTAAKEVYDFVLKVSDFRLSNIVVTATASKSGAATASKINRTAIEHIQANSLADIMSLLPGADITSNTFRPDLQGVKALSVRGGLQLELQLLWMEHLFPMPQICR